MRFDPDQLRSVARGLCDGGMEKTPAELEAYFRDLIRTFREAAARGGRHDIALAWTDEQVWARVQEMMAWGGPESGEAMPPIPDVRGLN